MPQIIVQYAATKPMLGVCLGHQAIGEFYGARLVKAAKPVHGKTSRIHCMPHPIFAGMPPDFSVMRYHSLLLESLEGTPLVPLAFTEQGELMAMAHRSLPLYGVQFHPESILTEYGLQLIENWIRVVGRLDAIV
jgi:anthranilate synthase/aminodeoxychorismate synthase-like glutamine amidotransferase